MVWSRSPHVFSSRSYLQPVARSLMSCCIVTDKDVRQGCSAVGTQSEGRSGSSLLYWGFHVVEKTTPKSISGHFILKTQHGPRMKVAAIQGLLLLCCFSFKEPDVQLWSSQNPGSTQSCSGDAFVGLILSFCVLLGVCEIAQILIRDAHSFPMKVIGKKTCSGGEGGRSIMKSGLVVMR